MIVVIIAGGSGTRLWPLSTSSYPKHLLKITNEKSLLQNTYERAALVSDSIYVVSEKSHVEHVYKQLPVLPKDQVICEPGRRGTANCFIEALSYIKSRNDNDEPIVFMHADHHIRDFEAFKDSLSRAAKASAQFERIVLLGGEPTYPATGFGYIERGEQIDKGGRIYKVKNFKEKPDHNTAVSYLKDGKHFWNMGFFVASLNIFESNIKENTPSLWKNYQSLLNLKNMQDREELYLSFESAPIDTALIEHVPDLLVIRGSFDWMDVGSFPDVHFINTQDQSGNTLRGKVETEGVTNSLILNDTDLPVAVIGLDNVIVVSTPNGIVVSPKGHAQKIGDVSKRINT
jgi:mannose-1-phosphate guanylyltransferase/mannose-6-phosphate isomerase